MERTFLWGKPSGAPEHLFHGGSPAQRAWFDRSLRPRLARVASELGAVRCPRGVFLLELDGDLIHLVASPRGHDEGGRPTTCWAITRLHGGLAGQPLPATIDATMRVRGPWRPRGAEPQARFDPGLQERLGATPLLLQGDELVGGGRLTDRALGLAMGLRTPGAAVLLEPCSEPAFGAALARAGMKVLGFCSATWFIDAVHGRGRMEAWDRAGWRYLASRRLGRERPAVAPQPRPEWRPRPPAPVAAPVVEPEPLVVLPVDPIEPVVPPVDPGEPAEPVQILEILEPLDTEELEELELDRPVFPWKAGPWLPGAVAFATLVTLTVLGTSAYAAWELREAHGEQLARAAEQVEEVLQDEPVEAPEPEPAPVVEAAPEVEPEPEPEPRVEPEPEVEQKPRVVIRQPPREPAPKEPEPEATPTETLEELVAQREAILDALAVLDSADHPGGQDPLCTFNFAVDDDALVWHHAGGPPIDDPWAKHPCGSLFECKGPEGAVIQVTREVASEVYVNLRCEIARRP